MRAAAAAAAAGGAQRGRRPLTCVGRAVGRARAGGRADAAPTRAIRGDWLVSLVLSQVSKEAHWCDDNDGRFAGRAASSPASARRVARARLSVMLVSVFSACVGRGSRARSAASSSASAAAASACAGPARWPSAAVG